MNLSDCRDILILQESLNRELDAAIEADQNRRRVPPLVISALIIRHGLHSLPLGDYWNRLADYLEGKHRRKRGEKKGGGIQRQIDFERALLEGLIRLEGVGYDDSIEYLAEKEGIHKRKIQESIARGRKYQKEKAKDAQGQRELITNALEIVRSAPTKRKIQDATGQKHLKKKGAGK